jgi:hypothetical protein
MGGALERGHICPRAANCAARKKVKGWRSLLFASVLIGVSGGQDLPVLAGPDNSSDTYSGDYQAGSLPTGTFIFLQYGGVSHSDAFINSTGQKEPNSRANIWEEFSRFTYFASLWGNPFVIEGEIPLARPNDVKIGGVEQGVSSGLVDPVLHLTYFFVADAKTERWLGFSNYFYFPIEKYDKTRTVNVATPNQFTSVPEIGYTEGLGKLSPSLKNFYFDLIANVSIHTDGDSPFALAPGVQYDKLTQDNSYDIKAFLRYNFSPLGHFALGIEKSWGGEQIASGGILGLPAGTPLGGGAVAPGPASLGKDDWLRGHFQASVPLARDFTVAADIFHDFEREGGFKSGIGAEIRLSKFFFPEAPMK